MTAILDDIDSVCELNQDQRKILEIAAKGAVDQGLNMWRADMETWVRQRVRNNQGDLEQFLNGVGAMRFGDSRKKTAPERQDIWLDNLRDVLND